MFKLPTAFWLVMSVLEAHAFGKKEIYFSTVLAVLSILNRGHFYKFCMDVGTTEKRYWFILAGSCLLKFTATI